MPSFEWPWAFALLPAPYLAYRFLKPFEAEHQALRVPFFARVEGLLGPRATERARSRSRLRLVGLLVVWVATVCALARPFEQGAPVERETAARDLLLAVDLSGSMAEADLGGEKQTRLDVVKRVVGEFVARRKGDRLGLIVFGSAPFVQVPFTRDTSVVQKLLAETDVGMAGPKTALGDAIGLSLDVLARSDAKSRVVVVLTDGNDTGSNVPPVQAARIAASRGVTVHVIGVGDPRAAGEEALNTAVLTRMTDLTGGRFFRANDARSLEEAYRTLDGLEPIARRTTEYQPKRAIGFEPLAAVIALLGFAATVGSIGNLRNAWAARRARPAPSHADDTELERAPSG
ncbi:MAG TPA: VWA domain-containing protein [Polyangiaceae bacterium]|nr:VWA domain-containing protein [Polyangiaceae bacterium]